MMTMTKTRRWVRWLLLLALWSAVVILAAETYGRRSGVFDQFDLLVDVRHAIVTQYVEEPDQAKMTEAAVRAMVEALDDPYTVYISPDDVAPFEKQIEGTFTGIGAEVDLQDNRLHIVSPLDDSPAWKAGILAGDSVLEIDGKSTDGMTIADAIKMLQGQEGTKVTLKVRHPSNQEETIAMNRAQINVQTVKGIRRDAQQRWDFMLDPAHGIGYVRISQFTRSTAGDLRAALNQLAERGCKGIILDLRFDPGGMLESAEQVSDMFLPAGKRIVSVKGRTTPEQVTMAKDQPDDVTVPLVVVANEASASAAEIVTGALSDNNRARFVGTRTFGKGSVQQVQTLDAGRGALKITTAYYYLPNGRNIHRRKDKDVWGVDPSPGCYVPMTPEQVEKMIKLRRANDVLSAQGKGEDPGTITPETLREKLGDPQLAAALTSLLEDLRTGSWPVVGLSDAQALALESRKATLTRQRDALADRMAIVDGELTRLNRSATQPGGPTTATAPAGVTSNAMPPATEP
jgi:carboxyl-terminal processing protease